MSRSLVGLKGFFNFGPLNTVHQNECSDKKSAKLRIV